MGYYWGRRLVDFRRPLFLTIPIYYISMKNLKIKATGEIRGNVPNDIAAALVAKGEAIELPCSYDVIGKREPVVENRDPVVRK